MVDSSVSRPASAEEEGVEKTTVHVVPGTEGGLDCLAMRMALNACAMEVGDDSKAMAWGPRTAMNAVLSCGFLALVRNMYESPDESDSSLEETRFNRNNYS